MVNTSENCLEACDSPPTTTTTASFRCTWRPSFTITTVTTYRWSSSTILRVFNMHEACSDVRPNQLISTISRESHSLNHTIPFSFSSFKPGEGNQCPLLFRKWKFTVLENHRKKFVKLKGNLHCIARMHLRSPKNNRFYETCWKTFQHR